MPTLEFCDVIPNKADHAWRVLKKFGEIADWHPDIAESRIENGKPDGMVGCVRRLTLADGAILTERLLAVDDSNRSLTYRFEQTPLPLQNYILTVTVTPLTRYDTSFIRWQASFDLQEADPEGTYEKLMQGLIVSGSDSLQAYLARTPGA
ncbi:MAG: SRPBCC family protein [Rhizobium sp.]|nr:MAG: SRPBCC family protein [Rhizobium sp.]